MYVDDFMFFIVICLLVGILLYVAYRTGYENAKEDILEELQRQEIERRRNEKVNFIDLD